MKSYLVFLFIILAISISCCSKEPNINDVLIGSIERISLIKYYDSLPTVSVYINNEKKHQLSYSNQVWITKASGVNYTFPITLDQHNGYFELHDQGTGGGGHVIQIAKYINSKNREIVAVNSWYWNPMSAYYLGVKIFTFEKGRLKQVTKNIFPTISIYSFIDKSFSIQEYHRLLKMRMIGSAIGYKLPRIGTTIKCFILKDYFKQFTHDRDDGILQWEKSLIRKFLSSLKRDILEINWDIKRGCFIVPTSHNGG